MEWVFWLIVVFILANGLVLFFGLCNLRITRANRRRRNGSK